MKTMKRWLKEQLRSKERLTAILDGEEEETNSDTENEDQSKNFYKITQGFMK